MKASFFSPDTRRGGLRLAGLGLLAICVVAPAFPLGPLAAPPLTPLAPLWAAYGWASEADEIEKIHRFPGVQAPLALAVIGLIQDQLAGGPLGLFVIINLAAFLIGRFATSAMRSPNILSLWAGFVAMCAGLCGVAALIAPFAIGGPVGLWPFAQSCAVTALLYPLVRPLYMDVSTV
jgi:hypothetical protein